MVAKNIFLKLSMFEKEKSCLTAMLILNVVVGVKSERSENNIMSILLTFNGQFSSLALSQIKIP